MAARNRPVRGAPLALLLSLGCAAAPVPVPRGEWAGPGASPGGPAAGPAGGAARGSEPDGLQAEEAPEEPLFPGLAIAPDPLAAPLAGELLRASGGDRTLVLSTGRRAPLFRGDPWETTRAGRTGLAFTSGVGTLYSVDSTVGVVDANFGDPSDISGDITGRLGLGVQAEYFPLDDWMVFAGVEYRLYDPDLGEELISFSSGQQFELFLGSRYYLPWRLLSDRLRFFATGKVAWIPEVTFDLETRLPFDPPLQDAVLVAPFEGSSYWSAGVGWGASYRLAEQWTLSLLAYHEWSLSTSTGRSVASLEQSTGNAFVDDILDGLTYDVGIEPYGWIGFLSLSYAP